MQTVYKGNVQSVLEAIEVGRTNLTPPDVDQWQIVK